LKLNLGCGFDKREGWLNADNFVECEPDQLLDIEATPWPFADNAFEHVLLKHVLEHVGAEFSVFKAVMRELYRVLAPDGLLEIYVPHVRSDTFWADPTHVRAFTPFTFEMMSKRRNRDWAARRVNATMLGLMMDVDFEPVLIEQFYSEAWQQKVLRGEIERSALPEKADQLWNVALELRVQLRAVK